MTYQWNAGLSLNQAIRINKPTMRSRAVHDIFNEEIARPMHKFTTLEDRHFGAITALEFAAIDHAQVTTEMLNACVQMVNGCGKNTATKTIVEALDLGLFKTVASKNDGRTTFYIFAPGIRSKLQSLGMIELQIDEAIKAQISDPQNNTAGADCVGSEYYFHCLSDDAKERAAKALSEKMSSSKKQNPKKKDSK